MSGMVHLSKVAVFFWMVLTPVFAWASDGFIFDTSGAVSIATDKTMAPRPAEKNDRVASGTVIRTGDNSHAVVKFEDGQVASMQANTIFQVREYIYDPRKNDENSIVLSMFKGGMHFVGGQIAKRNHQAFRLATPDSTISIHGTEFMVVMASDATFSKVLSGKIGMTNAVGSSVISAGQTALTFSSTTLTATVPATSVPAATFSEFASLPSAR